MIGCNDMMRFRFNVDWVMKCDDFEWRIMIVMYVDIMIIGKSIWFWYDG